MGIKPQVVDSNSSHQYRQTIYDQYVSQGNQSRFELTESEYLLWAEATKKRINNWLPQDYDAPILDMGCGHGNFLFLSLV